MKLYIGENIRRLRLRDGLTQEDTAERFGVSPQAVSRWETGAALPDLALLPGIANYFGVTLDELVGMDRLRRENALREVFELTSRLRAEGKLREAEAGLREALRLWPDNGGLLSELALTMTLELGENGGEGGTVEEAISLSERVLAGKASEKCKSTTAANLCFLYLRAGEHAKAEALVRQRPHVWECRELLLAGLAEDGRYDDALRTAVSGVLSVLAGKIGSAGKRSPDGIADGYSLSTDPAESLRTITEFLGV